MEYKHINFSVSNSVAIIKINRPEVLNSINMEMGKNIQDALDTCVNDNSIRAIVIAGEGRAFCASQDLAEAIPKDQPLADLGNILEECYSPIIKKIYELEKRHPNFKGS